MKPSSPSCYSFRPRIGAYVLSLALVLALPAVAQTSIFSVQPSPSPNVQGNTLNAVTAISPTDGWAVGYQNDNNLNESRTLTMHWDGASWKTVPSPNPASTQACAGTNTGNVLSAVSGVASDDVWAAGFSFDCVTFNLKPMVMHWDGKAWKTVFTPKVRFKGNASFNGILALATDNVYVVGYTPLVNGATNTLIEHWDGKVWQVVTSPSVKNRSNVLFSISGTASDLWAVGVRVAPNVPIQTLTLHYDGVDWKIVPSPNVFTTGDLNQNVLLSVQSNASNDVTAAGFVLDFANQRELTFITHWDGSQWKIVPSPNASTSGGSLNRLNSITALSPTDMYAAGFIDNSATSGQQRTYVIHFDGVKWSNIATKGPGLAQQLNGIFGLPGTQNVWTVGGWSQNGTDPEGGLLIIPQTLVEFSPIG